MQLLAIDLSYIYQDYSCLILSVILKATEERLESGSVQIMMGLDLGGPPKSRVAEVHVLKCWMASFES
jgi:hypothetical protein